MNEPVVTTEDNDSPCSPPRKEWHAPSVKALSVVDSTGNNGGPGDEGFGSGG